MNPSILKETKVMIPKVSLQDKISTDGFGMTLIEILVMVGILKEERLSETCTKWTACNNFNEKRLYLTMDGLSLDRYKLFKKKLMKIPQSYSDNCCQPIEIVIHTFIYMKINCHQCILAPHLC
jgi:hypothetical protein